VTGDILTFYAKNTTNCDNTVYKFFIYDFLKQKDHEYLLVSWCEFKTSKPLIVDRIAVKTLN
tara:strand:+ start:204 stop:389 length:186 start_codon:yes stop_codon:yes gene_type:complete